MKAIETIKYQVPEVEVIEVEVEKGFAVSPGGDGTTIPRQEIG